MSGAPEIHVEALAARRAGEGQWRVPWRIRNVGTRPLRLLGARLPHSHFRAPEADLSGFPSLDAGASALADLTVAAKEEPGTEIENAFLILRVDVEGSEWRVFVRTRVRFDDAGAPEPVSDVTTTQRVGHSGLG